MFPHGHGLRWRVRALTWALAGMAAWSWAVNPTRGAAFDADRFFFQTWETEHGLPQKHSTAILQTRDGYLWMGTYNGLARFDGARFVVFNRAVAPGLASSRITSLYEDAGGVLWLGHDAGLLSRLRAGRFEAVPLGTNWPGGTILGIAEDAQNDLWLLHENGLLLRVRDGATVPPEPGRSAPSLVREASGTLWRVHGGKMRTVGGPATAPPRAGPPEDDYIVRACVRRAGGFWLACGERVRRWDAGGGVANWGAVPWGGDSVTTMIEGGDGLLWVGTLGKGLFCLSADGHFAHYTRTNGLTHDWVRTLAVDREGTVWTGTGGGVSAARERRVSMVEAPDRWRGRGLLPLSAGADGALWMGTEGGGVYRLRQGEWTRFAEREGLTNLFVWSVLEDARGRVWAGTWGGGLFQLVDGKFVHPSALAGETVPVCALFNARDGALWAGTQRGLLRLQDGRVERFAQGLARPEVRTIAEAQDGTIWFGLSGGGLGRWRTGEVTQFRQADGLPSDYVWSLLAEADGTLWIGTFGGGLGRWRDGRFATIGPREGLPNNVIGHLADDGRGQLWMGSYGGILRASKEELNRCADGRVKAVAFFAYGKTDGLASLECAEGLEPGGCRTADGRLWFPTSKGLAVVDPVNLRTNPLAPPVVIEEVLVEGVPHSANSAFSDELGTRNPERGTLRVSPGQQRFEIRFTALSFVAPERVRFKYRLEGLEDDWMDAGTKRVANYSFLPPGGYLFRVIACNNDGVWNEAGATLALTVLPHFWQTWWFRVVVALASAGTVGGVARGITRRRYRRKLERLERQRAIEKERARIAKDIHDDLGASLTRITLLSQTARGDLDRPEQAAADLDRIYDTALELTQAMDEIVWAVNPHHDTLDSLVGYLGGFAQDFLSDAGVRCRLDVPLRLPALPLTADVRHNLFLAFKEAVHNVVRHAGATEARLVVTLGPNAFTLAIQDDGKGFAEGQSSGRDEAAALATPARLASGNGLINIRKRIEEIGGQCAVESAEGRGTLVKFTMPLKAEK